MEIVDSKSAYWDIETSDEFIAWYGALNDNEAESVNFSVDLLEQTGPMLGRPHVDTLKGSCIPNLKELRVQHEGRPLRILFAFDPRRVGYLILGGDKTGDASWYHTFIPLAEKIFQKHLLEIGG
ncbi:MAG TPA: type II toxin-antitoxin system RelE/ParE family toxin [Terracidiphilus sp.]|jgi:hypothetical protein|nr:type II toxin-antitoxin system RelE/ParE family toxin [Terracidiphilus sp.]